MSIVHGVDGHFVFAPPPTTGTVSNATRRGRSRVCACAASGHVAAAAPTKLMNWRRLIASPEAQDRASNRLRLAHGRDKT
jgi:hypothetical protein